MKRRTVLIIALAASILIFSGCSNNEEVPQLPETDISSPAGKTEMTIISENEESQQIEETEKPQVPETKAVEITQPIKEEKPKEVTVPQKEAETEKPIPSNPPKTESEKMPEVEQPKEEKPTSPPKNNATADDSQEIANKVVSYLNGYRSSSATSISGLNRYAQYRSGQLVSNFSHDTDDQRAAAEAVRYGQYIDPAELGCDGSPYWTANAREAIAKGGYTGTVDEVAKQIADLIHNSSSHWSYVGSSDYRYIGAGVTYRSGIWYCTVAVSSESYN